MSGSRSTYRQQFSTWYIGFMCRVQGQHNEEYMGIYRAFLKDKLKFVLEYFR